MLSVCAVCGKLDVLRLVARVIRMTADLDHDLWIVVPRSERFGQDRLRLWLDRRLVHVEDPALQHDRSTDILHVELISALWYIISHI